MCKLYNTKAVGEGEDDNSDKSFAKDIDSIDILAKARQPGTPAMILNARHIHNIICINIDIDTDYIIYADCRPRPVAAQASSQQTCSFVAATHDANLLFSV